MNILVTGGKGVVGTGLVRRLESLGHEVWVCDLKHSHEERYIRCDVGKYRQLLQVFERRNYDFVYHLAAEFGRWNGEDYYEDLWMTNCIGTKNMLRLQEKFGFKMVFASSSEVYGDHQGLMKEEVMDSQEIRQMNDYAIPSGSTNYRSLTLSRCTAVKRSESGCSIPMARESTIHHT